MAKAEDTDLEVDIAPAETAENADIQVVEAQPEPKAAPRVETPPEDAIEALKAQLQSETQRRQEAERNALQRSQETVYARNAELESNKSLVTNAIEMVKQQTEGLKARYREAMAVGDHDTAAEAQSLMATNAAKMLQLEQGKMALDQQPPARMEQQQADPVEALAGQLSPRSAKWVREHPEFATDRRLYQKMLAAHNLATADGIPVDSDDYFDAIEDTLRIRRRPDVLDDEAPQREAAQVTQRRSSPPAAPVSRTGTATSTRPNTVRLSREEVEMAELMGQTKEEYAKSKLALIKEGKLNG